MRIFAIPVEKTYDLWLFSKIQNCSLVIGIYTLQPPFGIIEPFSGKKISFDFFLQKIRFFLVITAMAFSESFWYPFGYFCAAISIKISQNYPSTYLELLVFFALSRAPTWAMPGSFWIKVTNHDSTGSPNYAIIPRNSKHVFNRLNYVRIKKNSIKNFFDVKNFTKVIFVVFEFAKSKFEACKKISNNSLSCDNFTRPSSLRSSWSVLSS